MMEMDYSPVQRQTYRGHESPMDFAYNGSGPVDVNSPFKMTGSFSTPARYPGGSSSFTPSMTPQNLQPQMTPFFTARTNGTRSQFTPFDNQPAASPLMDRGNQLRNEEGYSAGSPMDEDVVMLSAGATPTQTPTHRKHGDEKEKSNVSNEENKENSLSLSEKFMKAVRRNSSGSSPLSKLFSRKLSPSKKSSKRRSRYTQNSDHEDDDELFDSDDSEWSDRVVVKKTTVMRSPRKASSGMRFGSPRKGSRTISSDSVGFVANEGSLLSVLSSHDNLPFVFAQYLQLIFNVFLVLVMLYLIMTFVLMVRSEVGHKVEEYTHKAAIEIALCTKNYLENRCAPDTRTPYTEAACSSWQKCMDRDPSDVGRASVSAETIADILNSFIERLSYKSMVCSVLFNLSVLLR